MNDFWYGIWEKHIPFLDKCFPFSLFVLFTKLPPFLEALKHYWGTFVFSFSSRERIWLQKSKAIIGTFMYILMLKWKDLKYYVSIYVCVYVYVFACTYECAHTNAHVRTHDFSSSVRFLVFIFLMNVFMIEQNKRFI